jgi:hypothetical protein
MGCTSSTRSRAQQQQAPSATGWGGYVGKDAVLLRHRFLTLALPLSASGVRGGTFAMWVHGPADEGKPPRHTWEGQRWDERSECKPTATAFLRAAAESAAAGDELDLSGLFAASVASRRVGPWEFTAVDAGRRIIRVTHQDATPHTDPVYLRPAGLHGAGTTMLWGDCSTDVPCLAEGVVVAEDGR